MFSQILFAVALLLCVSTSFSTPRVGGRRIGKTAVRTHGRRARASSRHLGHPVGSSVSALDVETGAKIFGGHLPFNDTANFMAYIEVTQGSTKRNCTGVVLSQYNIVTTAHCFFQSGTDYVSADTVSVAVGLSEGADLNAQNNLTVKYVDIHEDYNVAEDGNDIAMITLENPLPSTQKIAKVSLAELTKNTLVYAAGYGKSESSYGTLVETTLKYINMFTCKQQLDIHVDFRNFKRCFTTPGGQDESVPSTVCEGDSGAPLFDVTDGIMELYGINTYRVGDCGAASTISVGTNLKRYLRLINRIIREDYEGWTEVYPDNLSNFQNAS